MTPHLGITLRFACLLPFLALLCAHEAWARVYFVSASNGRDEATCIRAPGPSTSACKSISYVVNHADLGGGDQVRIAAGRYRERIRVGAEDSGMAGSPVAFVGEGSVVVEGLRPAPLDDGRAVSCATKGACGPGAYPHVYRFPVAGSTVRGVVETRWTPIRVDDSAVTGVVFDLTRPIPSKRVAKISDVEKISGSFMAGEKHLFVHTYQNVKPSRSGTDLEIIAQPTVFELRGARHVRLQNLTLRYASQSVVLLSGSHDVELRNVRVHSAPGTGVLVTGGSARTRVRDVEVSHVWSRKDFSTAAREGVCHSARCGWHNNAGGTAFKIDGGAGGASGFDVEGLTASNAWNVVSIEQVKSSRFRDVLAKNSPNHTFIMFDKVTSPNCRNNLLEGILAFNGQDSVYIAGCRNSVVRRSAFNHWFQGKTGVNSASVGWKVGGVLASRGLALASDSRPGFRTDHNFMAGGDPHCKIAYPDPKGTVKYPCDGATWKAFGYDRRSRHSGVRLAGFSQWPPRNGLEMSRKTRKDFYPLPGSSTIDAGDPDLDGDGLVERHRGGDDECTAAHRCAGAGPDIGPFEYGLSGQQAAVAESQWEPEAPGDLQRDDVR